MPNEVKLLPCDRAIADALSDLKFGMDFAYEQGLHEFGYDPVETVRAALSRPTTVVTDEVVERVARAIAESDWPKFDLMSDDDFSERERARYFENARAALASMPTVVTGEQPESVGDHALPPSGLSQSSLSQAKPAAAIAREK